jgi:hypothetical protein
VAQELETETARIVPSGGVKGGAAFEYQTSSEGTELAVPLFVELGFLDRFEFVAEPVAYAAVNPKHSMSASGIGDLELTLVGLALPEAGLLPAIALAAEVKIPTARNALIGSREFDYAGYLIFSKRLGPVDLHLNVGYTIIGQPPGAHVTNIFDYALAVRVYTSETFHLFAEVLGNTSSSPEAEGEAGNGLGASAELAGGELSATVGAGYYVVPGAVLLHLGLTYDNNNAFLIHPGVTLFHQMF